MNRMSRIFLFAILVTGLGAIGILLAYMDGFDADRAGSLREVSSLSAYADQILASCADANFRPACYDEKIPLLLDFLSMEEVFQVTSLVQDEDSSYGYCHVLGHKVSEREAAKDPDNWMEIIRRCPAGVCANGCLHGAVQYRFRDETLNDEQLRDLVPDLQKVCEPDAGWQPIGLEVAQCYHGLGHMTMFVTDASFDRALDFCDAFSVHEDGKDYRALCYDGLFMQLFQPLEPEDFALIEGKGPQEKEELRPFCESFADEKRIETCWAQGWPWYREEISTSEGIVDFCMTPSNLEYQERCFNMLYYVSSQAANYDPDELAPLCGNLPSDRQGECFGHMATSMIHGGIRFLDQSLDFCRQASDYGREEECYGVLLQFADYNLDPRSDAYHRLCSGLPAPLDGECFRKGGVNRSLQK